MPKVSSASTEKVDDYGVVVDRASDLEGYTVNFVTFRESNDITEILATLPQGKCLCPHWGYVLGGRVTVRYDDGREELIEPGDAFYLPPGHTSWKADAGTELVQFSPTDLLAETDAAIAKAMQAASG